MWCAILDHYTNHVPSANDAERAARTAHAQAQAKAELVDPRAKGGVQDILAQLAAWIAEWQQMHAAGAFEGGISLHLETAALKVLVHLSGALSMQQVAPLFPGGAQGILWLAKHCHEREVREEETASADTFVNSEFVPRVLGTAKFPPPA